MLGQQYLTGRLVTSNLLESSIYPVANWHLALAASEEYVNWSSQFFHGSDVSSVHKCAICHKLTVAASF